MNWFRRIPQWLSVVRLERSSLSLRAILRALRSGPVPRAVWRQRLRTCWQCPIYNRATRACRRHHEGRPLGCGCYVPWKALTAAPYPDGCWGREVMGETLGWPRHDFSSARQKRRAILAFLFPFFK